METKRLLNVRETARYIGLSELTLRNRLGPKAKNPFPIKPIRIGRKVLFDIKKLNEWIEQSE